MLNNKQEVIDAFKTGIFPYIDGFQIKEESEEESEEESGEESGEESEKERVKKFLDKLRKNQKV